MSSPVELSLDCNLDSSPLLLKLSGDQSQKVQEFLRRLQEERLKIDAFKSELPLCMQLLNNAMEASRQQLETLERREGSKPVLEEFIPLKHPNSEGSDDASNNSEKVSWMTSAQLWSQANDGAKQLQLATAASAETAAEVDHRSFSISTPKLALDSKPRHGGAFLPFSRERIASPSSPVRPLPELALASADKEMEEMKQVEMDNPVPCAPRRESCKKAGTDAGGAAATPATSVQAHRKARRCWSPDLHHRFVAALQMLGGSQVATPKQIRELMKVDGLTNDEVKSHLQKYRLHTRRPSASTNPSASPAPQLVVLGGIWVPPEYTATAHGSAAGLYGAHAGGPQHYQMAQEFYPAPPHHPFHHHHHHFRTQSQAYASPEADLRGARDGRSESIEEDGKSDSSSWKGGESGENEEAARLRPLRDEGDESNGSGITLKF